MNCWWHKWGKWSKGELRRGYTSNYATGQESPAMFTFQKKCCERCGKEKTRLI